MNRLSMYEVEDWLPEEMKRIKRAALAGDSEAEFNVGLLYGNLSNEIGDVSIAKIGAHFIARAAKKGHTKAIYFFTSAGKNWRDYDY